MPANNPAIKKAEQILIDNGIETDEADIVLQAIGYALLDMELYPEEKTEYIKPANQNDVQKALDLHIAEKPSGTVIDADTILADVVERADMCVNDIGKELLENWLNGNFIQRECIEKTFNLLFDTTFAEYVDECILRTTNPDAE